ncbi:MAG TPA: phosphoribosylformylglycinamidine synthase subunit PurS [bacterium]
MEYMAKVLIKLKNGVLDPQGKTICDSINALGFAGVYDVRVGKLIELKLQGKNEKDISKQIERMCNKLLVNPVIENFEYEIVGGYKRKNK